MARPKIDPSHRRTQQMTLALSPVELAALQSKADAAKTNVTAFIRAAALDHSVTVVESTAPDFATRNELRRIGVNLNQIAKALNAGRAMPSSLSAACEKLDLLFDMWLSHGSENRSTRAQL